jgi:hypothetical protein
MRALKRRIALWALRYVSEPAIGEWRVMGDRPWRLSEVSISLDLRGGSVMDLRYITPLEFFHVVLPEPGKHEAHA